MMDITINYLELAFIMNIDRSRAKEFFLNHLKQDKITTKDEVKVDELKSYFSSIKSLDKRYDGQNELVFNCNHKSELYRKELSNKQTVKTGRFRAGRTIFYKICSKKQLEHFNEALKSKKSLQLN